MVGSNLGRVNWNLCQPSSQWEPSGVSLTFFCTRWLRQSRLGILHISLSFLYKFQNIGGGYDDDDDDG